MPGSDLLHPCQWWHVFECLYDSQAIFFCEGSRNLGLELRTSPTNIFSRRKGVEGFSTVRYSYLAESTGGCRDQVDPTHCHGEKLRFEENSMQSSEAVLALNLSDSYDEKLKTSL